MFYLSLRVIQDRLLEKLGGELQGGAQITMRGWDMANKELNVPSELSGTELSVSDITGEYCPTSRDLYFRKVLNKPQPTTWESYTGKAIHRLYFKLPIEVQKYVLDYHEKLPKVDLIDHMQRIKTRLVKESIHDLEKEEVKMATKPSRVEKEELEKGLQKIVQFESRIAGTLLDYVIAGNLDVRINSELASLFPVQVQEPSLNATPLGFSRGVRPDFLIGQRMIGDIKTGAPHQFHKLTVAAYALAYEHAKQEPVDFGVVFRPDLNAKRMVPVYKDTDFFVISDQYRRAVMEIRNRKFKMLKEGKDPGEFAEASQCVQCPYYPGCRDQSN